MSITARDIAPCLDYDKWKRINKRPLSKLMKELYDEYRRHNPDEPIDLEEEVLAFFLYMHMESLN